MIENQHPVLFHSNIFGNCGEFFEQYLQSCYADDWREITPARKIFDKIFNDSSIKSLVENFGGSLKSCSYQLPVRFAPSSNLIKRFICISNPVERAWQVFLRVSADSSQPNSEFARKNGFKAYVEWALADEIGEGGVVIKNYQTLHLSQVHFRDDGLINSIAGDRENQEAQLSIGEYDVVLLADKPVLGMRLLAKKMKESFPELNFLSLLDYYEKNSQGELFLRGEEDIASELGEKLFQQLKNANSFDFMLYEKAGELFSQASIDVADKINILSIKETLL